MTFDTLIRNGLVVDGTGSAPPFPADVGIIAAQIAAVGDLSAAEAAREVDAAGRCVCPGFIDVHVHSEISLLGGRDRLAGPRQGVTTQLLAPDGFGWACLPKGRAREMWSYTRFAYGNAEMDLDWPAIEDYLALFPGNIPSNVYPQVPHCSVRLGAMGWDPRPATADELDEMCRLTRDWMEAGAGALCLGLDYQPSSNADLAELVTLCRIAESHGGIYAAHLRFQILGPKAAWEETLELSRRSGIPVHVSHATVSDEIADVVEQAEREGIDLTFESYLYPAGMTHMTMMLPMAYQLGSPDEVLERLRRPAVRDASFPHMAERLGAANQIIGYTGSGRHTGLTLSEAAEQAGKPPEAFAYDLILEEEGRQCYVFPWQIPAEEAEAQIRRTATHPLMMIASDGVYDVPHPHPRGFGCFARVPGQFVRERKLLSLEEAIYKMSGFPANRFGLGDRGQIAKGKAADLVIFDPDTIDAQSTFQDPIQPPIGIDFVVVNGEPVIEKGKPTGQLPGQVLRRS